MEAQQVGTHFQWTPELEAILRQRISENVRYSIIGAELGGLSRSAVAGKANRLGLAGVVTRKGNRPPVLSKHERRQRNSARNRAYTRKRREEAPRLEPVDNPPEAPPEVPFLGLQLWELEGDQCHFPRGDGPFLFCGQPTAEGESYCPHCYRITIRPRVSR